MEESRNSVLVTISIPYEGLLRLVEDNRLAIMSKKKNSENADFIVIKISDEIDMTVESGDYSHMFEVE